jgi:phosphinothricin acetyltransferase
MGLEIGMLRPGDWEQVRAIFIEGMQTGMSTFETEPPAWERWDQAHLPACRLVAREDGQVLGWAALSPVSARRAYAGVAEVSIYIAAKARGKGLGKALLEELVRCSEENGFWTLQAVIFPQNEASLRLHARCGFRIVGRRERISRNRGAWQDTLLLERRSRVVGNDEMED